MTLIQFSHANGFPAGSYKTFLGHLPEAIHVRAIERIGVDPRYPVTPGWPHLVTQLCDEIEDAREDPILVGHSLGGLLSVQAAYRLPRKVRGVVMIDAPIISRWRALAFAASKLAQLDERVSPARLTKRRRDRWPSRDAAHAHLSVKPLFAAFDSRALEDYLDAGLVAHEVGLALAIDRAIETRIYRTVPHTLHRLAARSIGVPFGFIGGTRSRELALVGFAASKRFVEPNFRWFEGGHLFPMERPLEAAAALMGLFGAMQIL